MEILRRVVLLVTLAFGPFVAVQSHGADLVVVLTPKSVPFSYSDDQGRLVGFNVDIANAICRELARSCRLEVMPFPEIIPAVSGRGVDLGLGNFLRTPEREALVRFSAPYWRSTSVFVGRPGSPAGENGEFLPDGRICVIAGSMQAKYLDARIGDRADGVIDVAANQDLLDRLQDETCASALLPSMQALAFLRSDEGRPFVFLAAPLVEQDLGGTVHIAIRPDDPGLLESVDRAIATLVRSGEHERIARKYFPFNIL